MFNFEKVKDFDRHIDLSIPNYSGLCDIFRAFVSEYSHPEGVVVDIGCSTGSFLNSLPKHSDIRYIGIDKVHIAKHKSFDFILGDCESLLKEQTQTDVVISMFTLQFLGRHKRMRVISEMKRLVDRGSILLIAEKCFFGPKIENVLKREHLQQKRKGFEDSEILDKDRDLFGSMHCLTDVELSKEIGAIGEAVQVWQSYNFKGYIVYR